MKDSFFSRFLGFTVAFYVGSVLAVFILTVVKTVAFFSHDFWAWLPGLIKSDVFPIALAELVRSPLMGLLFALIGPRWAGPSNIRSGFACGAFSYAIAFFLSILSSTGGDLAYAVAHFVLVEYVLLGLPVCLIFLFRFFPNRTASA